MSREKTTDDVQPVDPKRKSLGTLVTLKIPPGVRKLIKNAANDADEGISEYAIKAIRAGLVVLQGQQVTPTSPVTESEQDAAQSVPPPEQQKARVTSDTLSPNEAKVFVREIQWVQKLLAILDSGDQEAASSIRSSLSLASRIITAVESKREDSQFPGSNEAGITENAKRVARSGKRTLDRIKGDMERAEAGEEDDRGKTGTD